MWGKEDIRECGLGQDDDEDAIVAPGGEEPACANVVAKRRWNVLHSTSGGGSEDRLEERYAEVVGKRMGKKKGVGSRAREFRREESRGEACPKGHFEKKSIFPRSGAETRRPSRKRMPTQTAWANEAGDEDGGVANIVSRRPSALSLGFGAMLWRWAALSNEMQTW